MQSVNALTVYRFHDTDLQTFKALWLAYQTLVLNLEQKNLLLELRENVIINWIFNNTVMEKLKPLPSVFKNKHLLLFLSPKMAAVSFFQGFHPHRRRHHHLRSNLFWFPQLPWFVLPNTQELFIPSTKHGKGRWVQQKHV